MAVLDQNQNQNQNQSVAMGVERRFRTRYNSDVESRLANVMIPDLLVPDIRAGSAPHDPNNRTYPDFHTLWDADLQACSYLDDFLAVFTGTTALAAVDRAIAAAPGNPGNADRAAARAAATSAGTAWQTAYVDVVRHPGAQPGNPNPGAADIIPPNEMNRLELGSEVRQILELGLEREARFAEIIDQDDGPGSINYWLGMLKIDPARHPATYLMVHLGRRIGEHVAMILKGIFLCPRPSQVSPWITPMIDPPVTPSFPAGHAVQSYLISFLLAYSFSTPAGVTNLPNVPLPFPAIAGPIAANFQLPPANAPLAGFLPNPLNFNRSPSPLFDLAYRVAENRIVAGIHYPVDIRAGQFVAHRIFQDIRNVQPIWGPQATSLRSRVRGEFPQYAA
jgi:membrane-associated phospholipid phosphatase